MKLVKNGKEKTLSTNAKLAIVIQRMQTACSMKKYLGLDLPKGKHTTLHFSALNSNAFEKLLRREKKENDEILRSIRKTCQMDYQTHLLN